MPEYVSPVKPAKPEVDTEIIGAMIRTLAGAADIVAMAGQIAHDVRTAYGLSIAFLAHDLESILPGRVASIDRGVTIPTVDEAWKLLEWAKEIPGLDESVLAERVSRQKTKAATATAAKKAKADKPAETADAPIELD